MAAQRSKSRAAAGSTPPQPPELVAPAEGPAAPSPSRLGRRGLLVLAAGILLVNVPVLHRLLSPRVPFATHQVPFRDGFQAQSAFPDAYFTLGGHWRLVDGKLLSPGVRGNPLWLRADLPEEFVVEVDVTSLGRGGEARVEFGNGIDPLSGPRLVHGGWKNTASGLFRPGGKPLVGPRGAVVANQTYRWRIERTAEALSWWVDGVAMMEVRDPEVLASGSFRRVGVSSAEEDVLFDDLVVRPRDPSERFQAQGPAPVLLPSADGFEDDFEREALGDDWVATRPGAVRLVSGALCVRGARNHPVWLRRELPQDAVIELEAWSNSPDGDIKFEAWGDGQSFHQGDPRGQYDATGYVFVFGGWRNTKSVLARRGEHGPQLASRSEPRVEAHRRYRLRVERRGAELRWSVDGEPFLRYEDPSPLTGPDQAFFALSGWDAQVCFDDVRVSRLSGG